VSNPFERLSAVADLVAQVGRAPELVAQRAAPKIAEKIEEQFALGLDPYGAPWTPLAESTKKKHGAPPLTDTGEMRAHTDAVSAGPNIIATSDTPAEFHQHGSHYATHNMPARPILPNEAQGLPQTWEHAIQEASAEIEKEIGEQVSAA
jgi:phage virion morphogenesis protein